MGPPPAPSPTNAAAEMRCERVPVSLGGLLPRGPSIPPSSPDEDDPPFRLPVLAALMMAAVEGGKGSPPCPTATEDKEAIDFGGLDGLVPRRALALLNEAPLREVVRSLPRSFVEGTSPGMAPRVSEVEG